MKELTPFLLETLVVTLVAILTKYMIPAIKSMIDRNLSAIENEKIEATLKHVNDILFDITAETTQTFVDNMKKEGKWDEQSKKEAYEQTRQKALLMISTEAKELIGELYTDFDTWLQTQIESSVYSLKD